MNDSLIEYKTLSEKEKMLVTSICSFSNNVVKIPLGPLRSKLVGERVKPLQNDLEFY